MENDKEHRNHLIEEWFPFNKIGKISRREKIGNSSPLTHLQLWWARRPLTVSRAAILGSILEPSDKELFNSLMLLNDDKKDIFSEKIQLKQLENLKSRILSIWDKKILKLLDPMAGGGSIPFESLRLGLDTYSNDLNPISVLILNAALLFPLKFKRVLMEDLQKFSLNIHQNIKIRITKYFHQKENHINEAYVWVKNVICPNPKCNLVIPLTPNWELATKLVKNKKFCEYGIELIIPESYSETDCKFKIIKDTIASIVNKNATINHGKGKCPRCNIPLSSEYIKNEALNGRMNHILIAIVYSELEGKKKLKKNFRIAEEQDILAYQKASNDLKKDWDKMIEKNLLPNDIIPMGLKTRELLNKGIKKWNDLFNSRQLLINSIILDEIINLKDKLKADSEKEPLYIKAIITYLQFGLNKILDYNSIQTMWNPLRSGSAHTFSRHDFQFKWSYCEMDIFNKGILWAMDKIIKNYEKLITISAHSKEPKIFIYNNDASNLNEIPDNSIDLIVIDPPYYDNVMYAELSDYFYVWTKRGLADVYPNLFSENLTDKEREAVANTSRFDGLGASKRKLATQDYEAKMLLSFKEMYRILQNDGILTIMFTHKSTDAWDSLSMSLMEAGFEITSTWSVHTEGENSLHIAKKNAVKSTILLVCRKRIGVEMELWWEDDVLPSIKKVVSDKVKFFQKFGIEGVDLFISCFGPALKEFSKFYPVRNIEGNIVRAEQAIEAARKVVIDITLQDIIKGKSYSIDTVSKFYLTAWHFFKARIFPFDEARRLALSIGINIDELKANYKILDKKSGDVIIMLPKDREKNGAINVDNPKDNGILINAVHIAILAYEEGGQKLYDNVVEKLRRNTDKSFRLYMETLFNILPDVKDLSKNLPEKKILGEILMVTEEMITPKGGKITDFIE